MSASSSSNFAARHWYRLTVISALLYPLSLVFRLLVWLRRLMFEGRILKSVGMPVPVIVVGNLTVGGTGKTPLVLWMVRVLQEKGHVPGVIVGGYGGSDRLPAAVAVGDDPRVRGDEAVLVAQRIGAPVWSGRQRVLAAQALLRAHPQCNVLICDDGLQHYRLRRDIEIAIEDERGIGNGLMLPAGPLREPANRRVDARVRNSQSSLMSNLSDQYRMRLEPGGFYRLDQPGTIVEATQFRGKRLHAVAGIGEPERFFATLGSLGVVASTHAFPDHHEFQESDLAFEDCDAVLMTEKDAVKCARFSRSLRYHLYALRVEAILDIEFLQFLEKRLNGLKAT